ncbi:MAG: hypothetical protein IID63_01530 [candidate division Zixibacteria bacterium]|nr:hypothetical protein [candidate division Zixibacteria bacterium]
MKNSLTILGGAVIIGLSIFIGLAWNPSEGDADRLEGRRIADSREAEKRRIGAIREKAVNMLDIHISDIKQVLRAIDETLSSTSRSGHGDVASHADEIEELTQKMRLETAELKYEDTRVLKLILDRFQHLAHELEHSAKKNDHEEAHHAYENMVAELENLVDEIAVTRSNL